MPERIIRTPDQRLRVFASSTLKELADERKAARDAIMHLRLAPVMFELGARPHPARDLYRAYLDQSHIFIGIYWQSCGVVAPGETLSGLEDEYRLSGDKPKLIYIKTPAPDCDPRLKELLDRIRSDDTASYKRFTSANELRELIENDLLLLLTERFEVSTSASLPTGTVTFLFTDIEGSAELFQRYPDAMKDALARHHAILRRAVESHAGRIFQISGDAAYAAFHTASDGLSAALAAQRALRDAPWAETGPIRARMGLHVGAVQGRLEDVKAEQYSAHPTLAVTDCIMSAGHGGQVLLSRAAAELVRGRLPEGVTLRDMGEHRLKELDTSAHVWQLVASDLPQDFPPLQSLGAIPNNLPIALNRFVGRECELRAVRDQLAKTRLLSLVGPGGTGKIRLALQAAAGALDHYRDGVYFVDLASIRDPESALAAIARAIGLREKSDRPLLDEIKGQLRTRKMLALLDNFEQVIVAAPMMAELIRDCPQLTFLVTSREALHVRGETVFLVPPLSLPQSDLKQLSLERVEQSEAVQLFVERAHAIKSDFRLTNENARAVAELCIRLDGLPLAVELATARLNLFSPQALVERLGNRLKLLRGGARDLPIRQQTLLDTIAWSYELLDTGERSLFELFAVFSGSAFEAVEEVAGLIRRFDGVNVLDGVSSLVDKSLIRPADHGNGESRLVMLETIREYAAGRLAEDAEFGAAARRAHATYYADLTRSHWEYLTGDRRETALMKLTSDIENIRGAWRYWVAEGNLEQLGKFIDSLWMLYDARGWYHATVELTTDLLNVLAATPSTPERAQQKIMLQTSLARALMAIKGFTPEVEQAYLRALELCQGERQIPQLFPVLRGLSSFYILRAEHEKGIRMGERILSLADHLGDADMRVEGHLVLGYNLGSLDNLTLGLDHLEKGIAAYDPRRQRSRRLQLGTDPGVVCLTTSALFLWMVGFPDRAHKRASEAVALARKLDHSFSMSYALFHYGLLHLWLRETEIAQASAGALLDIAEEHGFQIWGAVGSCLRGAALAGMGSAEEGLTLIQQGMNIYQGLKTPPVFWPLLLHLQAGACGLASRPEDGLRLLNEAIQIAAQGSGKTLSSEFFQLKGDLLLLLSRDNVTEAESWFQNAVHIAADVQARMLELRGALRLSRLWRDQGKTAQARKLLSEAYKTFTEGFAIVDLREAKSLLDDLAPDSR